MAEVNTQSLLILMMTVQRIPYSRYWNQINIRITLEYEKAALLIHCCYFL